MNRMTTIAVGLLLLGLIGCARQPQFEDFLPGLRLDARARMVSIDGEVCLERGILEYIAVTAGGKEYESVFRLYCRPAHLQQALLIADCQVGEVDEQLRGDYAGTNDVAAFERPDGAPAPAEPPATYWERPRATPTVLAIEVEVMQPDGSWQRRPIEELLIDRNVNGPPQELRWAFTGSYFVRRGPDDPETFAADQTLSVIALWYDPSAILNPIEDVGNPYRSDAAGLELNPKTLPPKNTPVRLILRAIGYNR